MSDGGAYSPFRSILLVLTHDYIITCVYGPTGSDGHERIDADGALCTILMPFEAKGVLYAWGPVQPANGPLHKLPPARMVIHRQTSAHERRKWTWSVQSRSGILASLYPPATLSVDNGRAPHFGTRHEEAVALEGGCYAPVRRILGSESLSL